MKGTAPSLLCQDGKEARELRRRLSLSQSEFWGALEVTQSGGSRYESSREMPEQVALLLHMVYGTEAQARSLLGYLRGRVKMNTGDN